MGHAFVRLFLITSFILSSGPESFARTPQDCLEASDRVVEVKYSSRKIEKFGSWKRTLTNLNSDVYTDASHYREKKKKDEYKYHLAHRILSPDGTVQLAFCTDGSDPYIRKCENPIRLTLPNCTAGRIDPVVPEFGARQENRNAREREWVVAVSERVPLSLETVSRWKLLAKKEHASLRILRFDQSDRLVRIDDQPANEQSLDATSNFSIEMGLLNHFPTASIMEEGKFLGLISGYKDIRSYSRFLNELRSKHRSLSEDEAVYREQARKTFAMLQTVHYEFTSEPAVELVGLTHFGSYFRPFFDNNLLAFPLNWTALAYLFDLTSSRHRFIDFGKLSLKGPYDLTTLPGSGSILLAFHADHSISLIDSSGDRVLFHDKSGNIYPSASLLGQSGGIKHYRMITNFGPTFVREFKVVEDSNGRRVNEMTAKIQICKDLPVSTPHITASGRSLTGTLSGSAALIRIHEDSTCSVALDFAIRASKIDTHPDETRFAFHSSYFVFADNNELHTRHGGNFIFDGPTGRIENLSADLYADGTMRGYYPSFLAGDRISLQSEIAGPPRKLSAQILHYRRVVRP